MLQACVIRVYLKSSGKLLLLKRKNDDRNKTGWCLPGGKQEENESLTACIIRELLEETCIAVDIDDVRFIGFYNSDIKGKPCQIAVFSVNIDDSEYMDISISEEHDGFQWVLTEELSNINLAGKTLTAILL